MSKWKVVTEDDVKAGLAQLSKPQPKWHKRDYEMVAGIIASMSWTPLDWKGQFVDEFIEVFGADNPEFKEGLFRKACEV